MPASSDQLAALADKLQATQRALIDSVCVSGVAPSDSTLRKIADLEAAIVATNTYLHDVSGGKD